jgi:hypothetical protein
MDHSYSKGKLSTKNGERESWVEMERHSLKRRVAEERKERKRAILMREKKDENMRETYTCRVTKNGRAMRNGMEVS